MPFSLFCSVFKLSQSEVNKLKCEGRNVWTEGGSGFASERYQILLLRGEFGT